MNRLPLAMTTAITICLAGCMHVSPEKRPATSFKLTPEEQLLLSARLGGGERPRLSVSMSGGGVRSSLYNFGALKALYDNGLLQQADLVSSVSGGSYVSYWLFSEQAKRPGADFASSVFENDRFGQRLCQFSVNANFVPWKYLPLRVAALPFYRSSARGLYEKRMWQVFGGFDDPSDPLRFEQLRSPMEAGAMPYLVMNATTFGASLNEEPWTRRYFEMTALHHGSFSDYRLWTGGARPEARLIQGALSSGAAISPLKRWFQQPYGSSAPGEGLHIWDGGKVENLGASSALRRGTEALIVIDAQFDNNGQPFSAYYTLQQRMANLGVGVVIDQSDEYARAGVYPGRARGDGLDTAIAYVKMERPTAVIDRVRANPDNQRPMSEADQDEGWAVYERFSAARGAYQDGKWECGEMGMSADEVEKLMLFNLAAYLAWADGNTIYRKAIKRRYPLVDSALRHDFPETTTVDQSMYIDQALAYIALGYLTAKNAVCPALDNARPGSESAANHYCDKLRTAASP